MFDQVLKTNLVGDEKELFYLLEFLQIKIDVSKDYSGWFDQAWQDEVKTVCSDWKKKVKASEAPKVLRKLKSQEFKKKQTEITEDKSPEQMEDLEISELKAALKKKSEKETKVKTPITTTISRILDMNHKDLDFSLIALPENFSDSYHGFIFKACDLCHGSHSKADLILCMLCGELMCGHSCRDDKESKGSLISAAGNIFRHAMAVHGSAGVFFNAFNGQYVLYEGSRWFSLAGLFINSFGVSVNETKQRIRETDYREFNLDLDKLNRIKKDILNLSIDSQIVALNIIENVLYRPTYL